MLSMIKRLALAAGAAALLAGSLAACGSTAGGPGSVAHATTTALPTTASSRTTTTSSAATCSYPPAGKAAKPVKRPPAKPTLHGTVKATITTTQGAVPITLDAATAPCTVNSFVSLAKQGYFDDTPCHRLTTSGIYVLQCGDPTGTGAGGPGYSFKDELSGHDTYPAGTLAMANAGPNTNGSQFFLCYGSCTELNSQPNYTVFGKISAAGLSVLREVAAAGQDNSNGPGDGHPKDGVKITRVTVG